MLHTDATMTVIWFTRSLTSAIAADRILIYEGTEIGSVRYGSVNCTARPSNFVETEGFSDRCRGDRQNVALHE